jgi:hypothetical protein
MIRVIVQRCLQYPTSTFGIMCVDDEPEFLTVENPWLDNQRNISLHTERHLYDTTAYKPDVR